MQGKNDNAATTIITPNKTTPNAILSAFKVPSEKGIVFFAASEPIIAMGPIIGIYLPNSIIIPVVIFQKGVLSISPSKPEPLFAADDVNSYNISENP